MDASLRWQDIRYYLWMLAPAFAGVTLLIGWGDAPDQLG